MHKQKHFRLSGTAIESARLAWQNTEGTNEEIAKDFGVSTTWFYRRFGPRGRSSKHAN